jgi:hypothetical protein
LGLDEAPDHSTFSKNRHGRFRESDFLRKLFETAVARCMKERLVGGAAFAADAHQPVGAGARAPGRLDRLGQRSGEREHEGEMADLDDHGLATASPSCHRPCFLSASTTSRGM